MSFAKTVERFGAIFVSFLVALQLAGCGTTRWSDTQRTATEQLVISEAIDRTVSKLDLRVLAGRTVFFEEKYLESGVDRGYLISSIRQHLLANGCLLQEDRAKADYVVEARAGAIGTDRHDVLFGVPQLNLPMLMPGIPSQIPEINLAKKTNQVGVAKVAVFAYNRKTGESIWQSGVVQNTSAAKNIWILGVGPFQRGLDREGTTFAGTRIEIPLFGSSEEKEKQFPREVVPITRETIWSRPSGPAPADSPAHTRDKPGETLQLQHETLRLRPADPPHCSFSWKRRSRP